MCKKQCDPSSEHLTQKLNLFLVSMHLSFTRLEILQLINLVKYCNHMDYILV